MPYRYQGKEDGETTSRSGKASAILPNVNLPFSASDKVKNKKEACKVLSRDSGLRKLDVE